MMAEMRHTLRRMRGQIVGWSIGLVVYGLMMIALYPHFSGMEADVFDAYIGILPDEMLGFFPGMHLIATPMGYIDVYFFSYLHLIIGIFAISAGAGILAGDEEKGVLDLVMAQPVSRTSLFVGRLLGLAASLALILAAAWLSWALPADTVDLGLSPSELLLPFIPLLAVLLMFAALAVLLSMITPSARMAGMITGALMVGNYLLLGLSGAVERLRAPMEWTPLHYYQGGMAIEGLNGSWLLGLLAASLLAAAGAWLLFLRRDIRVGGERSWSLGGFSLLSRSRSDS